MSSDERTTETDPQPCESESDYFGPALPPHLLKRNNSGTQDRGKVYGPTLETLRESEQKEQDEAIPVSKEDDKVLIGPEIPAFLLSNQQSTEEEEETQECTDDNDFGPSTSLMTSEQAASTYYANNFMSKSTKQDDTDSTVKRESWMTELPKKKNTSLGLIARHFSTRVPTDKECDDSVWTDTPADKERKKGQEKKKDHKDILKMKRLKERDKEMEKLAKKAAKILRKKESLLEIHQKSLKKKKKKESKKREKEGKTVPERRPFDRNIDLQIRKIDEGQRRAILNKSQFLNDRFAAGESRFL